MNNEEKLNESFTTNRVDNVDMSSQMKNSFLNYAMSVIVSRALPDVRDGLKPVHRRILYSMIEQGITPDKPHKKSARVVGDVIAKYHPHGDSAVYESMVRMAQDFSYRNMLVDGHGNFGSIDGDEAAAMRYTESRLSKIAMELVRDLNKDTVDFIPNFDGEEQEPEVMPSRFPNLLVNGAQGIAVGMATSIPTHNLGEVTNAIKMIVDNPDVSIPELMTAIPAPDFPTGGIIVGTNELEKAYTTGRGSILVRSRTEIIEQKNGKQQIVVHDLPYVVNKARLIEKISELARDKKLEGISAIRDESDREAGVRISIDVKRDASAEVVLNNLFKQTQMQSSFSFNMLAIDKKRPRTMNLKEILEAYLEHQREIIKRRTKFDLERAEARAHILEGLRIALDNIDQIIEIIRSSKNSSSAKESLIENFSLSQKQSQAILDMRLSRLTGLEREKIENEYQELVKTIADFRDILSRPERVDSIIVEELSEISNKYGNPRRTEIRKGDIREINDEDLIDPEEIIITLTKNGYIKRMPISSFRSQNRGGRGAQGMNVNDNDYIEKLLTTNTHDSILFFTNTGRVFDMKGYKIPEYGKQAKGIPVVNLIKLQEGENVQEIVNVKSEEQNDKYLLFVTRGGIAKRVSISEFGNIRTNGLKAIKLKKDDELISILKTDGKQNIIIGTRHGYSTSFSEDTVRSMGRQASGIIGIRLREDDYVIGSSILEKGKKVLVISENGFSKQTNVSSYPIKGRGGKGIKTINANSKTGLLAGIEVVSGHEDIIATTNQGVMIRFSVSDVSTTSRVTQGVKVIKLENGSTVATFAIADKEI